MTRKRRIVVEQTISTPPPNKEVTWEETPPSKYIKLKKNSMIPIYRRRKTLPPVPFAKKTGLQKQGPSFLQKAVGVASGATLGFITGNVPGAVVGGELGYAAVTGASVLPGIADAVVPGSGAVLKSIGVGNSFTENSMASQVSRRSGTQRSYSSRLSSRFASAYRRRYGRRKRSFSYRVKKKRGGVMKKKKKMMKRKYRRKMKKYKKNPYLAKTKGYEIKVETFGATDDPHCLYLKHSTFYVDVITNVVCGALLRKLFDKSGWQIAEIDERITATGNASYTGQPYRMLFNIKTSGGVLSESYLDGTLGGTLKEYAENFTDLRNWVKSTLIGGAASASSGPAYLSLQAKDEGAATDTLYKTRTRIELANETMHLHIKSTLKVQNRTSSAVGGSTSTDQIDVQPLQGYLYTFRNGDPRLNMSPDYGDAASPNLLDAKWIGGVPVLGVELIKASALAGEKWKEPPHKHKFRNCVSMKKVMMNPGDIQFTAMKYSVKGKFYDLMKRLKIGEYYTDTDTSLNRSFLVPGKCQLLALEEVIRTNDTNKITLGYEREITVGCWFVTHKKISLMSSFGYN